MSNLGPLLMHDKTSDSINVCDNSIVTNRSRSKAILHSGLRLRLRLRLPIKRETRQIDLIMIEILPANLVRITGFAERMQILR